MLIISVVLAALVWGTVSCENVTLFDPTVVPSGYIKEQFIDQMIPLPPLPFNVSLCRAQLLTMVTRARQPGSEYFLKSFKFFDAWGKIPAGITYGHLEDLGNYPQCVSIDFDMPLMIIKKKSRFVGKYCHAKIPIKNLINSVRPKSNFKVRSAVDEPSSMKTGLGIGICVPESCTVEELSEILTNALNGPAVEVNHCTTNSKPDLETMDIIAITVFSVLALLILLSTVYDYVTKWLDIERRPLLLAFSLITNSQKLFAVSLKKNPNSIDCIHGIRVISMVWVVYGHASVMVFMRPSINLVDAYSFIKSSAALVLLTAPIAVDTFFFISGLLVTWVGLGAMTKSNGKINVFMMYLQRYLRLTPMLGIVILFTLTLLKYCGNGPFWSNSVSNQVVPCQIGWWRNLLYIQNYFNDENCVAQTWYLAVDTQLYLFAPFILMGYYRWGNKFIGILILLVAIGTGALYTVFITKEYTSLFMFFDKHMGHRMKNVYLAAYMRFPPWVIGSICGYLMFTLKGKEVKMPKIVVLLGWFVAIGTIFAVVYGPNHLVDSLGKTTAVEAASYEAFSRISWSISLGWIVFACHYGYGGIVNKFLGHYQWQLMSRLSFGIYMVHITFQGIILGNSKSEGVFSTFEMMGMFWFSFGISTLLAVVLILACESPVINLEKILLSSKPKPELPVTETDVKS